MFDRDINMGQGIQQYGPIKISQRLSSTNFTSSILEHFCPYIPDSILEYYFDELIFQVTIQNSYGKGTVNVMPAYALNRILNMLISLPYQGNR